MSKALPRLAIGLVLLSVLGLLALFAVNFAGTRAACEQTGGRIEWVRDNWWERYGEPRCVPR